jgi:SPX domain protein involved in polyphosphate accumulation
MVEFGEYLLSLRNPEWAAYYLNYEHLKALLYNVQQSCTRIEQQQKEKEKGETPRTPTPAPTSSTPTLTRSVSSSFLPPKQADLSEGRVFEEQLDKELDKINGFYLRKKLELG